jgi:hypothetical protein
MARHRKDLGTPARAGRPAQAGISDPAPDAWIECTIVDVSEEGACVEAGVLVVPDIFGLAFTAGGEVLLVCSLVWRGGKRVGARFLSAREVRGETTPADAEPKSRTPAG